MFTLHTTIRRIATIGVVSAASVAAVAALAAAPAGANAGSTSYEVHVVNQQPDRLVLRSATIQKGTTWTIEAPEYIDAGTQATFAANSTSPNGAQVAVTYVDPTNGATVSFTGNASTRQNGSIVSAVPYGGLQVSGYQGYFAGFHPHLNLRHAVTGETQA